ncbi:MAG: hypothetical protein JO283_19685 [Bradyrhizobium sp.]|nr:hypothetical protein [Bradyrhizobium sp.]
MTRSNLTMGLLLGALLSSPPAQAQTRNTGDFISDPKSGCKVWDPHPFAGETASWSGNCIEGFAQGPGSVLWSRDGKPFEKDEGSWDRGRQSGRGSQDWGSGRYQGEFVGGEPSGQGVMSLQTARYEGEFRNGKPSGEGTATNLHGVYKGRWKDGCLRQGEKTIAFAVPSSSCH